MFRDLVMSLVIVDMEGPFSNINSQITDNIATGTSDSSASPTFTNSENR